MATFAVTGNTIISHTPYLVRKLTCTGGATELAYTHGEDRAPDLVIDQNMTDGGDAGKLAAVRTSATQLTFDTAGDVADAIEVYLIWFSQASGSISS